MSFKESQPSLRRNDLWGAWESASGSDTHVWNRGVIVFKPYGNDVIVEHWLPAQNASSAPIKNETLRGGCIETSFGIRLSLRSKTAERTLDIVQAGNETITVFSPGT